MPVGDIETFHMAGEWHNMSVGERSVISTHPDQATAVSVGRKVAQERRVVHTVTNLDGTIAETTNFRCDRRDVAG